MALPTKTFVVAPAAPAQATGTNIILRRLLANFDPRDIVVLARRPDRRSALDSTGLPYPVIMPPSVPRTWRGQRYWSLLASLPAACIGQAAAKRHAASVILGMFPDEASLLTAYMVHRWTGLPLVAYFCDLYMEDRRGWQARLARWLQPRVFRAAARILVMNEGMRDYYWSKYGLDAVCLPACINTAIPTLKPPTIGGPQCIVGYSGNINTTRVGSLRALLAAIGDDRTIVLRYFTPQTPDDLRRLGVWHASASAEFVGDEEDLIRRLAACDILFLPLAFESEEHHRDQLATSFATKSFEYFLSRKPILLHAPADSFIARFYRERGCGLVVDDPSPAALAVGLKRLRDDDVLRSSLVVRALEATREFEGPVVARRLIDHLKSAAGAGKRVRR